MAPAIAAGSCLVGGLLSELPRTVWSSGMGVHTYIWLRPCVVLMAALTPERCLATDIWQDKEHPAVVHPVARQHGESAVASWL